MLCINRHVTQVKSIFEGPNSREPQPTLRGQEPAPSYKMKTPTIMP